MSFLEFNLHPALLANIASMKYLKPSPIQVKTIPVALDGKDILGIAKTGSGKTASFVIPILNDLLQHAPEAKSRQPKVLVLVPTRELAVQVNQVFKDLSTNSPQVIKSMAVYGGVSINPQMKALYGTQILIATPGRLLDLNRSKAVDLSKIAKLVIDEADKMLNMGFEKEMQEVFMLLPKQRQNMLFSATLSEQLSGLNSMLLNKPEVLKIENQQNETELINLTAFAVNDDRKGPLLRHLIKDKKMNQVLVFTSSGYTADKVAHKLSKNNITALAVHGKKSQAARLHALDKFKAGKLQVLVATDLISRGIDIQALPYVINYELPRSPKDFIHRIGRTGRADTQGIAITFVSEEESHHFKVILKKAKRYVDLIYSQSIDF